MPLERPKDKDRRVVGWGGRGPLYADDLASRHRESVIRLALQESSRTHKATRTASSRSTAKKRGLSQRLPLK